MTHIDRFRAAGFDPAQAAVLHLHLKADPEMLAAAHAERARCAGVIAAGRLCHITEKTHAALAAALQRTEGA